MSPRLLFLPGTNPWFAEKEKSTQRHDAGSGSSSRGSNPCPGSVASSLQFAPDEEVPVGSVKAATMNSFSPDSMPPKSQTSPPAVEHDVNGPAGLFPQ